MFKFGIGRKFKRRRGLGSGYDVTNDINPFSKFMKEEVIEEILKTTKI